MAVLALGVILLLRPAKPGGDQVSPAPPGAGVAEPETSGSTKTSPSSSPGRESRSTKDDIARKPTGASSTDALAPRPQVVVAGQPNAIVPAGSQRLRLLVPAYIYPVGDGRKEWQRLIDAAAKVKIVAIANPSSGPGEEPNFDYAAIFTEASDRGITLVGYVSTDYGKRPMAEIKKDIDAWIRFYPQIRGFFFDQQPRESRHATFFARAPRLRETETA